MKKVFKIVGITLAIIIILPLIVSIFAKKEYDVLREVTINTPVDDVFNYVVLLKNQDEYSVWSKMDPNQRTEYRGADGTVGFVSAWDSDDPDVGTGEQEITGIVPLRRIDYELRFLKPFKSTSNAFITTASLAENTTRVQWGFTGKMAVPMNLMLLMMDFEKMIGDDLQKGLDNLKEILEKE